MTTNFPIYETRTINGEEYIAIRKYDEEKAPVHVLSRFGVNYGAWSSMDQFAKCRKEAIKPPPDEKKLLATPVSNDALALSVKFLG